MYTPPNANREPKRTRYEVPQPQENRLFEPPFGISKGIFRKELTANITIWLFKQLIKLGANRKYVEVELRVGRLSHKNSKSKTTASYVSEGILLPRYSNMRFVVNTSQQEFETAGHLAEKLHTNCPPKIVKTEMVDRSYKVPGYPQGVRISTKSDETTGAPINKIKYNELYISLPLHDLDFKIGVALEMPVADKLLSESGVIPGETKPFVTRKKARTEFIYEDYQICLTNVGPKCEIEVELDQSKLLNLFQKAKRKDTPVLKEARWLEFEELVASLIDAATAITPTGS